MRVAGFLLAASTALMLLGVAVLPFLTPAFVRLEQDRTGVGALTGYDRPTLDQVAGELLGDLVLWRGDFDVAAHGIPVLTEREREHMRDVRGVFTGFWAMVVAAAVVLVVGFTRTRGTEATSVAGRAAVWRAVSGGARSIATGLVVVGGLTLVAFDAAFEVFHRLFFSAGSFSFDPRVDRLVQLFPEQFWSETAIAVAIVALAAAVLTAWQAARRAGARTSSAARLAPSPSEAHS